MDGEWMLTSDSVLDDAEAYVNRGRAYAKGDLDRAIALKPDLAKAYSNRGAAYAAKGDLERAIADFRKVLALSDDPRMVGDVKQRLEELGAR